MIFLIFRSTGLTDNKHKLSMLLTYTATGHDTYKTYENIVDQHAEATLDYVIQEFDTHFKQQLNVSYKTFLIRQMKQLHDKTVHQFYIRLREHAGKC